MQVGLIGINHKLADLKLREILAKACDKRFSSIPYSDFQHILLSTCNRTEIYFSSSDLAETHIKILQILRQEVSESFDKQLYSFFGLDCFIHLSKVTAGLDSACIAETEIQGQVKNTYEKNRIENKLCFDLHYLFQKSLAIGKQVRSSLNIPQGLPDFEDALFEIAASHVPDIRLSNILFVGASTINKKIVSFLEKKNLSKLSLYSRSKQKWGIKTENNLENWVDYDIVIFGSNGQNYIISSAPKNAPKLIFDLSVPRNVDPILSLCTTLYNIDDVQSDLCIKRQNLYTLLAEGSELIHELTRRHLDLFQQKYENKLKIAAMIA